VLHYVLDPFPWLLMAVYELYQAQQRLFEEENPDADDAASWLSQLGSASASTISGQSSAAEESVKRASSDAEKATPTKTKANKKASTSGDATSSDGESNKLQDEIKQLKKKLEKQNKTVANMKKLSASNKKAQQKIAALEAIIAQGGVQADGPLSGPMLAASGEPQGTSPEPHSNSPKTERKKQAKTQTKPTGPAKVVSLDPGDADEGGKCVPSYTPLVSCRACVYKVEQHAEN
jgi:hypothetical protein